MDQIKKQLVQLTLKIKRCGILAINDMDNISPIGLSINLSEFFLLHDVAKTASEHNFSLLDIQNNHYLSKSGISKMLGTLEEKGYLIRELDKNNRRKITITLTEKGRQAVQYFDKIIDDYLTEYINSVGEDYLKQLFVILNHIDEVNEKVIENMRHKYFKINHTNEENKHASYTG
jgi:DNA-binding MarR family transcriptional regulator